ncbi:MAG TPA: mechanosensitive ion channel domain-containing protein [Mucilaginibacter sp.]|nr:mechanosensitive ion channel domain-containing protein [Mucilaginibacter sp.]
MSKIVKALVLIALILASFGIHNSFAQEKKKKPKNLRDSARKSMHARDSILQAISKSDTSINSLLQRVAQYNTTFNQINNSLAEGLDTAEVSEQLPIVVKRISNIQSLANTKKSGTLRYLFVLRDNIDRLQDQMNVWQSDLDDVNTKLVQNQHDILKFAKDSLLKIVPSDSALRVNFIAQRAAVKALWRKTDSVNRSNLFRINLLQNKVTTAYASVLDQDDQIDSKIKKFTVHAESGEFGYLWEGGQYPDFTSAFNSTVRLNKIQLNFFAKNETVIHLIGIAFLVIVGIWIFYNRAKTKEQSETPEAIQNHTNYVYTSPIASTLLLVSAIVPFFYGHPPVIFLETLFLVSLLCAMVLVKKSFAKSLFNFLHQIFWIAFIYSLSNLLIQITDIDRYLILLLSIASIVITIVFLRKVKRETEGHLPGTRTLLVIFIVMQSISLILNLTGRFSLAKIVGVTAVFNLWMLVTLYFIILIIIQGIFIQFHVKKAENTFITWIDYNILQKKFRSTLSAFAALLWLFFLLQNLDIDDWVHDYLTDVLNQSRTIGGASFTFGGFVIFIIVIWISTLLSKMISYFYDLSAQHATDLSALKKKNRASTLLIRIGVFTVGFLLAVAASGFPIDKLTIIFSAFGVGIGFGLQNIVNNLVSGMILAFEKPVQIGDIIEVGSHAGTIKEIGIRSSKLATSDGSEVIIPNGDLISQQVTNWTLSNTNRRVEMLVAVANGSDIEKVKKLLTDMLCKRDDIMSTPGPAVYVNNITDKAVEYRASFWAADISNAPELRSRILADIYEMFNKNGIKMPAA